MSKTTTATPSATASTFAASIVQQLDVLSTRRKQWEATDYKKANEGLYALLADTLAVHLEKFVNASDEDKVALRKQLIERLTANRVRVVKTSPTLTMLTRYVFNADRKRAQGYAYVLAAAVSHNVSAAEFATWVVKEGGLEEIKRKNITKPETLAKQEAVKAATVAVKGDLENKAAKPLTHVGLNGLTGEYAVLLVKPKAEGGADVVGTLSDINEALVNALIQRMAKAKVAAEAENKELKEQIQRESADLLAAANDEELPKVVNG
jgi:hypothetical protein